jgi:hypothetical protein
MLTKHYCAQGRRGRWPNRRCAECSLTNYGLDCHNNPVPTDHRPKQLRGMDQAMETYRAGGGFCGEATINAILSDIPDELRERLTGHELGLAMLAVARAYHKGRASHGGLDLCDEYVWLPWGGGLLKDDPEWQGGDHLEGEMERGQLVPINALRTITITHGDTTHYTMDYAEH